MRQTRTRTWVGYPPPPGSDADNDGDETLLMCNVVGYPGGGELDTGWGNLNKLSRFHVM